MTHIRNKKKSSSFTLNHQPNNQFSHQNHKISKYLDVYQNDGKITSEQVEKLVAYHLLKAPAKKRKDAATVGEWMYPVYKAALKHHLDKFHRIVCDDGTLVVTDAFRMFICDSQQHNKNDKKITDFNDVNGSYAVASNGMLFAIETDKAIGNFISWRRFIPSEQRELVVLSRSVDDDIITKFAS